MRLKRIVIGMLLAGVAITATVAAGSDKVAPPAWLEAKIAKLPKEKRDFLLSEKAEGMAGSYDKLFQRLEKKSPAEIEAYIDGMLAVVEANKFHPDTDMASIPLNTESPMFNGWKTMRPRTMDPKREPGPFSLSYYMNGRGGGVYGGGIATFAGAPVAIYPEDLVAGKVDVAIVGAPLDMGSGYRGAKSGPSALRNQYGAGGIDMFTMVDPSKELNIVDYGDIAVDNMSTERTVHHVRERVAEIARTGAIPFIVGGDHSLEYSDVAGLADVHGKGSFGVVHFDSHFDAGQGGVHFITHGAPVYRAVKEGHVLGRNYIQVGLRGPWPEAEGFEWMRNNGVRYHAMPEIEKNGWQATMERALKEARESGKKIFISFDVDVLDPAFAPGTGTPVPGGLTMREALPIVRRLCAENELVGFEIVEVAPQLDSTYRTALNANFVMHACLTGVAMRKKGITQAGYLSDLTTEHQQPSAGQKGERDGKVEKVDPDYGWRPKKRPTT
ncbi:MULTISPECIES: agmatinase family protein [Edaphosphingomonas]|uniref:Arginase n=2 Tax=Edaphosphingomonas TaxID=3423724 RepID=A0A2T4HNF5_9SPHN|nr:MULTISPECIES: agmatinase family protein [Sphingomonas]OHT21844.1 Proclavaminate amidinohydrolase [Sphingomonas haloaromaticamans]PTD17341.1 arginase [Sphingomonas fennica]